MDLTVEDIHTFVNAINEGRKAIGLEPLVKIEFDACDPGSTYNCLSARHLFTPADGKLPRSGDLGPVGACTANLTGRPENGPILAEALGTTSDLTSYGANVVIPQSILRVTDAFDRCDLGLGRYATDNLAELRELFVKAGYVNPR